jgi:hypothetical protein
MGSLDALSPDGTRLLSISDESMDLLETPAGRVLRTFRDIQNESTQWHFRPMEHGCCRPAGIGRSSYGMPLRAVYRTGHADQIVLTQWFSNAVGRQRQDAEALGRGYGFSAAHIWRSVDVGAVGCVFDPTAHFRTERSTSRVSGGRIAFRT